MIVAGFGFRSGVQLQSLEDALQQARGDHHIGAIATLVDKAETAHFRQFADKLGLCIRRVELDAAAQVSTLTKSAHALNARGTGSVAEAAALVAAGPRSELIAARVISKDRLATCALARSCPEGETE